MRTARRLQVLSVVMAWIALVWVLPRSAFPQTYTSGHEDTKSNHMTLVHVNCRDLNLYGLSEGSTVPIFCGLI
jgi:hypothetical protein